MSRMPPEEAARYRLDDCLGGTSATVHQRAIRRIYGDKSADIVEGLKRNPGKPWWGAPLGGQNTIW